MTQTVYLDNKKIKKLLTGFVPKEKIEIISYPDARLKRVAKKAEKVDGDVQHAALSMLQLHYATPDCAALAATQVSFSDPYYMTVIDYTQERNQPLVLINPLISSPEGEQEEFEGCMSVFPSLTGCEVKRAQTIVVDALDYFGEPLHFKAEGFFAKCIQHEVDHLDGKLYIDRLSSLKRRRVLDIAKKKRVNSDKK
jgi:peptide deformylase